MKMKQPVQASHAIPNTLEFQFIVPGSYTRTPFVARLFCVSVILVR